MRVLAIAVVVAMAGVARADEKPWAKGVAEKDQAAALKLYQEGNAEFVEDHFKEALAKYEDALKLWAHPAIQYNAGICYNSLDRPLEAYVSLDAAIKYGSEPIGKDHYATGRQLLAALKPRITELVVECKGPCLDRDVEVFVDKEKLDPTSGWKRLVVVGKHMIVATKPNYLTDRQTIDVAKGERTTVKVELKLIPAAKRLARRWAKWKPWAVVAAGGAIAALGAVPLAVGNSQIDKGNTFFQQCGSPCFDTKQGQSDFDRGHLAQGIGVGSFIAGGVVALGGLALVLANQPRLVAPEIGRDHVAIAISGRW